MMLQSPNMRPVSHPQGLPRANSHELNRWSTQSKLLLGAGSVTLLALAIIATSPFYDRYQNGGIKTKDIHCDRGFSYYNSTARKAGASGTDEYCLAEMFRTGNGTTQSLREARNWYKQAYDHGLHVPVKEHLCKEDMFEHKWGSEEEYEKFPDLFKEYHTKFKSICCPRPCSYPFLKRLSSIFVSTCLSQTCPWEKDNIISF